MKKSTFIIILAAAIIVLASALVLLSRKTEKLKIIEKESYFDSFEAADKSVIIKCFLTIENRNNTEKIVNIYALFPEDVKGGLLKEVKLTAFNSEGSTEFLIPKNSKASFEVEFIGAFAGNNIKQNRLLPEIHIIPKN